MHLRSVACLPRQSALSTDGHGDAVDAEVLQDGQGIRRGSGRRDVTVHGTDGVDLHLWLHGEVHERDRVVDPYVHVNDEPLVCQFLSPCGRAHIGQIAESGRLSAGLCVTQPPWAHEPSVSRQRW